MMVYRFLSEGLSSKLYNLHTDFLPKLSNI